MLCLQLKLLILCFSYFSITHFFNVISLNLKHSASFQWFCRLSLFLTGSSGRAHSISGSAGGSAICIIACVASIPTASVVALFKILYLNLFIYFYLPLRDPSFPLESSFGACPSLFKD